MTVVMITNNVEEAILLSDRIVPVLSGPPAMLGTPIVVELARPRSAAALAHEEQATHVRATVISALTAALGRPKSPPAGAVRGTVTLAVVEETR
jgi:nitrate/nitrite transport system ATP-binding protein